MKEVDDIKIYTPEEILEQYYDYVSTMNVRGETQIGLVDEQGCCDEILHATKEYVYDRELLYFGNGYDIGSIKMMPADITKEEVLNVLNEFKSTHSIQDSKEYYYTFDHPTNFL